MHAALTWLVWKELGLSASDWAWVLLLLLSFLHKKNPEPLPKEFIVLYHIRNKLAVQASTGDWAKLLRQQTMR